MNAKPIVVEQTFHVPVAVLWKAITDPDQMRQWFFGAMADFKPEVGFETQFNVRCDDHDYLHLWKVTDVLPQQRISYQWRYGGCPGDSSVTWELSEESGGARLRLTHTGQETFPQDDPNFKRESCQAGWDFFLHESLKGFLDRQST